MVRASFLCLGSLLLLCASSNFFDFSHNSLFWLGDGGVDSLFAVSFNRSDTAILSGSSQEHSSDGANNFEFFDDK